MAYFEWIYGKPIAAINLDDHQVSSSWLPRRTVYRWQRITKASNMILRANWRNFKASHSFTPSFNYSHCGWRCLQVSRPSTRFWNRIKFSNSPMDEISFQKANLAVNFMRYAVFVEMDMQECIMEFWHVSDVKGSSEERLCF